MVHLVIALQHAEGAAHTSERTYDQGQAQIQLRNPGHEFFEEWGGYEAAQYLQCQAFILHYVKRVPVCLADWKSLHWKNHCNYFMYVFVPKSSRLTRHRQSTDKFSSSSIVLWGIRYKAPGKKLGESTVIWIQSCTVPCIPVLIIGNLWRMFLYT